VPIASRRSRSTARLRVLSDRVAFRGDGVGEVHQARIGFPSGAVRIWTYLIKRPFVMVLAIRGNRVVLVRQHRYPQGFAWEVVKGGIERGETSLAAAKRELREETGYTARRWQRIARIMVAPGYFNQASAVYVAMNLRVGTPSPEANGEILRVAVVTAARVRQMIARGAVYDSTTLAGLLLARRFFPL